MSHKASILPGISSHGGQVKCSQTTQMKAAAVGGSDACSVLRSIPELLRDIELLHQLEEDLMLRLCVLVHALQVNDTHAPRRLTAILLLVELVVQS